MNLVPDFVYTIVHVRTRHSLYLFRSDHVDPRKTLLKRIAERMEPIGIFMSMITKTLS